MALLGAAPVAAGGCCLHGYPKPTRFDARDLAAPVVPLVEPAGPRAHGLSAPVIDVHAHFFNASDVPVRGFVAECVGHSQKDPVLRHLIELAALILEAIARAAPTAAAELQQLRAFDQSVQGLSPAEASRRFATLIETDRTLAAERLAKAINGTALERELLALKSSPAAPPRRGSLSVSEIRWIVDETRRPSPRGSARSSLATSPSDVADGFIAFLVYMLSMRASNLETHHDTYASGPDAFGIDLVLGSLVDFDYWLDCPPMSAHEDQIALHQHLAAMHDGYLQPVVGYNPWTDIAQGGAGLKRVRDAWATGVFVAAKIYPPTGFMPSGNADHTADTKKRRPNLKDLDASLSEFFALCAQEAIPVLAHAARSNGRDSAHDDFSNPRHWGRLLSDLANKAGTPIISFGHIGGDDPGTDWTAQFTQLIKTYPKLHLFGDLGYWDHLMCQDAADCARARARLKAAIGTPVVDGETVGDRVMFATDWLMMSQVPDWQAYPLRVREGLEEITDADGVVKIFGANARKCFARLAANPVASV